MCAGTPNSINAHHDVPREIGKRLRCAGLAPMADYLNR